MKKVYHLLTRPPHNQILTIVERKKFADHNAKYEKAMQELKEIYWREKELLVAIPVLMMSATTFELIETLTLLKKYTNENIKTLEKQFPGIASLSEADKQYKSVSSKDIV